RHLNLDGRSIRLFLFDFESLIRTQNFRRTAAGNNSLQSPTPFYSAGHFVDQLAHGDLANFNFKITGALDVAAHANDSRPGVIWSAELRVFRAAHGDDMFHRAKSFDVVDDCRTHVEPEHGREIRRLDSRICALALERFDQPRFFTAN